MSSLAVAVSVVLPAKVASATQSTTWEQAPVAPSARLQTPTAYDSARHKVVLFGGFGGARNDDTWEFDATHDLGWQMRSPATTPPGRRGAGWRTTPDTV